MSPNRRVASNTQNSKIADEVDPSDSASSVGSKAASQAPSTKPTPAQGEGSSLKGLEGLGVSNQSRWSSQNKDGTTNWDNLQRWQKDTDATSTASAPPVIQPTKPTENISTPDLPARPLSEADMKSRLSAVNADQLRIAREKGLLPPSTKPAKSEVDSPPASSVSSASSKTDERTTDWVKVGGVATAGTIVTAGGGYGVYKLAGGGSSGDASQGQTDPNGQPLGPDGNYPPPIPPYGYGTM